MCRRHVYLFHAQFTVFGHVPYFLIFLHPIHVNVPPFRDFEVRSTLMRDIRFQILTHLQLHHCQRLSTTVFLVPLAVNRFFEHVKFAALSRRIHLDPSQRRSPLGFVQTEARDSLVQELTESNWPKPASFRPTTADLHLHCHQFHFGTTHCTEALLHGLGSSRCSEILQLIAQCLFVSTKYYHLRRQCYQNMSLQHRLNMVLCHIRAHAGRCCIHVNQSTLHCCFNGSKQWHKHCCCPTMCLNPCF